MQLYEDFPGDIGCFCVFFMNHIILQPGESIFLGPNNPHAYLKGGTNSFFVQFYTENRFDKLSETIFLFKKLLSFVSFVIFCILCQILSIIQIQLELDYRVKNLSNLPIIKVVIKSVTEIIVDQNIVYITKLRFIFCFRLCGVYGELG